MATNSKIKFGTSTSPCNTATAGRTLLAELEMDDKGNCDPDRLQQCPFDKNHQIRVCRFPYHLLKCRKNHPKLSSELKTCPFNARHLLPKHELTGHIETCAYRTSLYTENGESTNGHRKWKVPASTWVNTNPTEDWDKEIADAFAPSFVLDTNIQLRQLTNGGDAHQQSWSKFENAQSS